MQVQEALLVLKEILDSLELQEPRDTRGRRGSLACRGHRVHRVRLATRERRVSLGTRE